MGGDNAPRSNVEGALEAVREIQLSNDGKGVEVALVGRGDEILSVL